MDLSSFTEGPLLWIVLFVFIIGIITRLVFFSFEIIKSSRGKDYRWRYSLALFGRSLLPFHNAVTKRPLYATLRYIFHICLIAVPIWFSGHITLWEESRFEWTWRSLPYAWTDWMTLLLLGIATYFLIRRIAVKDIRLTSSMQDYVIILLTASPFITGYWLTHGSLDSIALLGNNMWTIHILSGEAMIIMAVFLFCRIRLNAQKCVGCAVCELNCPTGTLESTDEGNLRIFTYSHYQCICCGVCVHTCPEEAADLRHEISVRRFFHIVRKQETRSLELTACERCGALFAPAPQLEKIGQTITSVYLHFCPPCRKANLRDTLSKLAPWRKKIEESMRLQQRTV